MKLHEHPSRPLNQITGYRHGEVSVAGRVLHAPCIVAPGTLVAEWITGPDALDDGALEPLWPVDPRIVLLGIAPQLPLRWRDLRRKLAAREMALEVMDVGAACRTYNVLAQEDRAVAALLFP